MICCSKSSSPSGQARTRVLGWRYIYEELGAGPGVRHDGRVKLRLSSCELDTMHMAKCAAFAPRRRLEVPNSGNVHRPSPQVVPDWTA